MSITHGAAHESADRGRLDPGEGADDGIAWALPEFFHPVTAFVASVNVGVPKPIWWRGRLVHTAIWKAPVAGRLALRGVNLAGDDQADRSAHGGPDKAVYAYAHHDLDWWSEQLGRPLPPGTFGENFTIAGLAVSQSLIGERWRVGTALLEVSQPRSPCFKLGIRMNDDAFPRRFAAADRPGAYLRILEGGHVGAGDPVEVVHRPTHGLTAATISRIYHRDRSQAARLLDVPALAEVLRTWAAERTAAS